MISRLTQKILPAWLYILLIGRWDIQGFKRYTENTIWAVVTRLISIIVSLIVTIYLVRYLGPANYGQLSYALSFIGIFGIIAGFGIDNVLYRELIEHPTRRNEYLGTAFILKLIAGVLAAALTIIFALLISPEEVSQIIIFILAGTFIFQAFNIIQHEFQANVAQKYLSLVTLAVLLILNVLKVAVIFFGKGVLYIGVILLFEAILYAILYIYIRSKHYGSLLNWSFDNTIASKLLRDSWPFIFITAFSTIYYRIDQVMLMYFLDATAVGLYDAAVRLSEVWIFFPTIFAATFFPAIVNARKTNPREYKKRLIALFGLVTVTSTIIASIVAIFSKPLINLVYGEAYLASTLVLEIYIWSSIFTCLGITVHYFLTAENMKKTLFFSSCGVMVVNVVLNILLIPTYGIVGAAFATLMSYAILTLPAVLIFKIDERNYN